jgi:hypothetical protein
MRLPRFSIGLLLIVIALCGLAVASLRNPSYLWANAMYTAAAASVVVASIQTAFGRRGRRAFWAGFVMAAGPYIVTYSVPSLRESVCPKLLTEPLLDMLYPLIAPPPAPAVTSRFTIGGRQFTDWPSGPAPASRWAAWTQDDRRTGVGHRIGTIALASPEPFRQVGHCLMILACGTLGGAYARRVRETGQEATP